METREKGISGAESEMKEKPAGIRSPVKALSPFPVATGGEKERTGVGAVFLWEEGWTGRYRQGLRVQEGCFATLLRGSW